jgi:hypothetical protein
VQTWAVEFAGSPRFARDAGSLKGAFVVGQAFGGKAEIHEGIRSRTLSCKEVVGTCFSGGGKMTDKQFINTIAVR